MDGMLVVTIIGIAVTTLGLAAAGIWAYNEAVKRQFDLMDKKSNESFAIMFRRLDENKKSYWDSFVTKDIHAIEIKNMRERYDEHYNTLVKKIDDLTLMMRNKRGDGG